LAQRTQDSTNAPAAAPQEEPRGLEVPVGPDQTPPADAPATPAPDASTTVPRPLAPAPDTVPDLPPIIGNVAEAEGREVSDVRVVGNRVIAAEIILSPGQVRTQRGAAFSARQVELDRGRIEQLGFFATVQVQVTPDVAQANRVEVTFIVEENPVVNGYKFVNSTLLKDTELIPVITSRIGAVLNRNTVNADVAALQKLYSGRGYAVLVESARLMMPEI
jgi:outer membrane protein assembly factor BamA